MTCITNSINSKTSCANNPVAERAQQYSMNIPESRFEFLQPSGRVVPLLVAQVVPGQWKFEKSTEAPELQPPGKLHGAYLEKMEKISKETAASDEEELKTVKISQMRYSSIYLLKPQKNKTNGERIARLKEETARRLLAYTSERNGEWFTLNDKGRIDRLVDLPHGHNLGPADLLPDLDIKTILIKKKDGPPIKAKRGIAEIGEYKGRLGFLDGKGHYIPTVNDDKFRILSNKETSTSDEGKYIAELESQRGTRQKHKALYQELRGSAATFKNEVEAEEAAKEFEYSPDTSALTKEDIETAAKECTRKNVTKDYYRVLREKKKFMKIVEFCSKKTGVPREAILTTIKKESGYDFRVIGDHGSAVGFGQLHTSRWKHVQGKSEFAKIIAEFTDKPVKKMRRDETALVGALSVALIIKDGMKANGIEDGRKTPLSQTELAMMRIHFHVPSKFRDKKFVKNRIGRYYGYANEVLIVRQLLESCSKKEPKRT